MKQLAALTMIMGLCTSPAHAQDESTNVDQGFSLMEEGAKLLMRGLMSEMEPALTEVRDSFEELAPMLGAIGPALANMLEQVDDMRHYQVPEFLPNGDIILRRKPNAPIWMPDDAAGEIDL